MKKIIITCIIGLVLGGCTYDKTDNQVFMPCYTDQQQKITGAGFADEKYIWETWTPVTNRVERFN